jgi:two-component system chemotaxis response regulator CheB
VTRYLVLDDSPTARLQLAKALRAARGDAEVVEASQVYEALRAFRQGPFDVVFLDVMLPGLNGADALRSMLDERPDARIVLVTGLSPAHPEVAAAKRRGPFATLAKPFTAADVRGILDAADAGAPPR